MCLPLKADKARLLGVARDNSHIGKLKMILSRRCEEDDPDDPCAARSQLSSAWLRFGSRLPSLMPGDGRLGRTTNPTHGRRRLDRLTLNSELRGDPAIRGQSDAIATAFAFVASGVMIFTPLSLAVAVGLAGRKPTNPTRPALVRC